MKKLFSDLLDDRRVKFAGHILRSNNSDPLRRVNCECNCGQLQCWEKKRGCPRQQWLLYTSRSAWEKMKEERSKILWNKITKCWNLQEAVNFEYRRRMPTVSPMCHESGTEPWQSKDPLDPAEPTFRSPQPSPVIFVL